MLFSISEKAFLTYLTFLRRARRCISRTLRGGRRSITRASLGPDNVTQSVGSAHITIGEPYWLAMYSAGKTSGQVTYRDGREVAATAAVSEREVERIGLTTKGEFGPILAIVVSDALHNKLYWDHWEPGDGGPVAVFRYTVPQSGSHYTVNYPSESGVKLISPGYHGLLALDPETGAVMRLTIVADMQAPFQLIQVGIAVEYGPVHLGDKTYICPLHAVALSRQPAEETQSVVAASAHLSQRRDFHELPSFPRRRSHPTRQPWAVIFGILLWLRR